MTVSKTNITDLAQKLCQSEGDTTTIAAYFDEVVEDLARREEPPFIDQTTFNITDGTSDYSFDSSAIEVLGVLFEGRQLSLTSIRELDAYDIDWRAADEADPIAWLKEEQAERTYQLHPTPDADSASGGIELYSEAPTTTIQEWYALYLAFGTLAEEFSYISEHMDTDFAQACQSIAGLLELLLRIR